jgi:ribosomal protein S3AE
MVGIGQNEEGKKCRQSFGGESLDKSMLRRLEKRWMDNIKTYKF